MLEYHKLPCPLWRFGGAITSLKSTLKLTNSYFESNNAEYAGASVYYMYGTLSLENGNNTYNSSDIYTPGHPELILGSSNYTMILNNSTFDGIIPSYYILKDTPVKDQYELLFHLRLERRHK